jgi:hypothetical protein
MSVWMEGHGCELAVRIDGKSYFVDGSSIDSMVMRMPKMVLCCHKKAEVVGKVVDNKFKVTSFKLLQKK